MVLKKSYNFITKTIKNGESILIHSVKGQGRACCIIIAYLMKRYTLFFHPYNKPRFRWTLYKTLEFMHFRRPDLEIRANFFNQLVRLENKLTKLGFGAKTFNWNEIGQAYKVTSEELLLTNTFLNA